jgi:hypothetical protein
LVSNTFSVAPPAPFQRRTEPSPLAEMSFEPSALKAS